MSQRYRTDMGGAKEAFHRCPFSFVAMFPGAFSIAAFLGTSFLSSKSKRKRAKAGDVNISLINAALS